MEINSTTITLLITVVGTAAQLLSSQSGSKEEKDVVDSLVKESQVYADKLLQKAEDSLNAKTKKNFNLSGLKNLITSDVIIKVKDLVNSKLRHHKEDVVGVTTGDPEVDAVVLQTVDELTEYIDSKRKAAEDEIFRLTGKKMELQLVLELKSIDPLEETQSEDPAELNTMNVFGGATA